LLPVASLESVQLNVGVVLVLLLKLGNRLVGASLAPTKDVPPFQPVTVHRGPGILGTVAVGDSEVETVTHI
jgi:hypothetical protein